MVFILLFTSVSKCETFYFPPVCVCNFVFIEVIVFSFLLPSQQLYKRIYADL